MFGLEAVGYFRDEEDIAKSPEQTFSVVRPGDVKYKDQNGDEEEEDHQSRQALKDVFEHKRASFPNQFLMYISSRVKLRMMVVRSPW